MPVDPLEIDVNGRRRRVQLRRAGSREHVTVDGRAWAVDGVLIGGHTLSLLVMEPTPSGDAGAEPSGALGPGGTSYEVEVLYDHYG